MDKLNSEEVEEDQGECFEASFGADDSATSSEPKDEQPTRSKQSQMWQR